MSRSTDLEPLRSTLPPGTATGIGSMPGSDVRDTAGLILGELPDLPHLAELPARGAGADMIGRTMALLPGFAAETVPTGWRLTDRRGPDARRALAWLDEDLDTVEELADGFAGSFKVSLAGPLTLAAAVELGSGERLLRDHGAVRDMASALAEASRAYVWEVHRRLPRATILVQIDEPSLPAVLAAQIPTASGFATLRRVDVAVAELLLRDLFVAITEAGGVPMVHSCAAEVPIDLLWRAGARGISVDLALLPAGGAADQAIGECIDAGVGFFAGVVPTDGSGSSDLTGSVDPVKRLWHRLGFAPELLASSVVLTPACGLAAVSPPAARRILASVREAARSFIENPEVER